MIKVGVSQLANNLGVHRNTIRNWMKQGRLNAQQAPGKGILLEEQDLEKLCTEFGLEMDQVVGAKVNRSSARRSGRGNASSNAWRLGPKTQRLASSPQLADVCLTCGTCASACPISGADGMDPRKCVRMVVMGREEELIESNWPWKCTLCGKCEEACPMNVEIVALLRAARGLRDRDKVPSPMHKGVLMDLKRGNNLGIPKEDFLFLLEDLSEELQEEWRPDFKTAPVDKQGANILVTVNSKEPFNEPEDMTHWWKIFYAAEESWTIPSEHWEGVNWALFTGDDANMKTLVGRIVANMQKLGCKSLLLPE